MLIHYLIKEKVVQHLKITPMNSISCAVIKGIGRKIRRTRDGRKISCIKITGMYLIQRVRKLKKLILTEIKSGLVAPKTRINFEV